MSALSASSKYYKEAFALFQQCSKISDRQDLANKVFEEACADNSDSIKVTKSCSRELEQLLPYVTSMNILAVFFDRLSQSDLNDIIRDRAACFVLEKLLARISILFLGENNEKDRLRTAFDTLVDCVCSNFEDYIQETGTSHIVAATIHFLHTPAEQSDDNDFERLIDGGQTPKKFVQLPSEWDAIGKLRRIAKLAKKQSNYRDIIFAAVLRTSGHIRPKLYEKLVKQFCSTHYPDLNVEHLLDKRSSFIFEVLLEYLSEERETLIYPLVLSNIEQFYLHPVGNFFLQHLLLSVTDATIVERVYQAMLIDERFNQLLKQSHIRLLITFIRICERFGCHYEELINRLQEFIGCKKKKNVNDFVPRLLAFRAEESDTPQITKEGSLVVQALLRARKVDSSTRQSFFSLTDEQIASIACHPSGSHLLCQLILKSSLWPLLRQKNFYTKLDSVYSKMACDKAGCWFVTQLWKSATTAEQKLQIAKSMSSDLATLRSHPYARFIAYEMNLTAYCSRPDQWRRSLELAIKKHALLDDLEGDGGQSNRKKTKKKKMQQQ